jgi:hypothetical protein
MTTLVRSRGTHAVSFAHVGQSLAVLAATLTTFANAAIAALPLPTPAVADDNNVEQQPRPPFESEADGTYGRIDGDLAVVVGFGVTAGTCGLRSTVDIRARYLDTVGVFTSYEDATVISSRSDPRRAFVAGLEVRPLFLARWLKGLEFGSSRADLAIDSLGLEMGAVFVEPVGASFTSRPGLQLGVGLELPFLKRASGPFLGVHGGVRWSDGAMSTASVNGPADRALYISLTVAWHQLFGAHVVDIGDRAVR